MRHDCSGVLFPQLARFQCVMTISQLPWVYWDEFGQQVQMLGVKYFANTTTPQSNHFARSPCTPRIPPHSRAHVSHCASQAPPRFVGLTVRPDSRRKEFGVLNHLPWDRPRTIMQAITAWYYTRTPDIGSRNTTKTNLVNYRLQLDWV